MAANLGGTDVSVSRCCMRQLYEICRMEEGRVVAPEPWKGRGCVTHQIWLKETWLGHWDETGKKEKSNVTCVSLRFLAREHRTVPLCLPA